MKNSASTPKNEAAPIGRPSFLLWLCVIALEQKDGIVFATWS